MDNDPMAELPADLKQHMTRYKAPPGLKRRIRYSLAQPPRGSGFFGAARASWNRWVPVGASFACGALLAVSVMTYRAGTTADEGPVESQVVASHVRSLMGDHLMDVASTDQHTVKPWFTGKLDYAPPVIDLAEDGFPLVGGRLDYVQDRPAAALVYRRRGHTINVFILPEQAGRRAAAALTTDHGYQVARWTHAGMRFWAVSDLSREEMAKFAAGMQAAQ
ncbi:MAG: prtR [Ramlibacter sp.]|jgi:anti-sigma factor RsiW|nr:prtR [Ramlibacter sp.]